MENKLTLSFIQRTFQLGQMTVLLYLALVLSELDSRRAAGAVTAVEFATGATVVAPFHHAELLLAAGALLLRAVLHPNGRLNAQTQHLIELDVVGGACLDHLQARYLLEGSDPVLLVLGAISLEFVVLAGNDHSESELLGIAGVLQLHVNRRYVVIELEGFLERELFNLADDELVGEEGQMSQLEFTVAFGHLVDGALRHEWKIRINTCAE